MAIWAADVCSRAARQLVCIEPTGPRLRHIGKTDPQCGTVQFCSHSGRLTPLHERGCIYVLAWRLVGACPRRLCRIHRCRAPLRSHSPPPDPSPASSPRRLAHNSATTHHTATTPSAPPVHDNNSSSSGAALFNRAFFRVVQVTKSLQDPLEVGNNFEGISTYWNTYWNITYWTRRTISSLFLCRKLHFFLGKSTKTADTRVALFSVNERSVVR